MFALLDHLGIETFKGIGVSGGGNVLLHLATKQPERVKAMVLVSATSYFPAQAQPIRRTRTGCPRRREKVCGGDTPAETRRLKRFWRAPRRLRTAMTT
jgi:pimeloyl-ACP methyl ester carboxylesterase